MYQRPTRSPKHRNIDGEDRAGVCKRYQGKVLYLARRLAARLPSDCGINVEDLASYGAIGLLEAFDHFDETMNIRFGTYAEYRIRGAMLDALRSHDKLSRRQRNLAERLGIDLEKYWKIVHQTAPVSHMSLEDSDSPGEGDFTSHMLDSKLHSSGDEVLLSLITRDTRRMLEEAILFLPERKRQCVMLYYGRNLSLAEIGEVYGVSVSRISQILSESRRCLRKILKERIESQDLDWREAI